jgi:hypothetical protein
MVKSGGVVWMGDPARAVAGLARGGARTILDTAADHPVETVGIAAAISLTLIALRRKGST